MIKGHCNGCGACCRAIALDISPESLARMSSNPKYDSGFAQLNWTAISREAAFEINPFLKLWECYQHLYFYTCKVFDPITNKCGDYENRPPVCQNYPHYRFNSLSVRDPLYSADCGFTIDRERKRFVDVLSLITQKRYEESFLFKALRARNSTQVSFIEGENR